MPKRDLEFTSGWNDSDFMAGLRKMENSAKTVSGTISKAMGSIGAIGGVITGGFLASQAKGALDFAGALQDTSDALDINVEALQGLQGAFSQSGAGAEQFNTSLNKLIQAQQDALGGNSTMEKAFSKLGITLADLEKDSPDEILLKMADGFKNSADKGAALGATMDILGKGGKSMAAGLSQGREEVEKLAAAVSKLSASEVKDLDDAGDAIDRFMKKIAVAEGRGLLGVMALGGDLSTSTGPATETDMVNARYEKIIREQNAYKAGNKSIEDANKPYVASEREVEEHAKRMKEIERINDQWAIDSANTLDQAESAREKELQGEREAQREMERINDQWAADAADTADDVARARARRVIESNINRLEGFQGSANAALSASMNQLGTAEGNLAAFNETDANGRREMIRGLNKSDRQDARAARMRDSILNRGGVDARSGNRRLTEAANKAKQEVTLAQKDVDSLAKAIAAEVDKLIVKP